MTNYVQIERDFIERTLKILDQYEEVVRPQLESANQYEVTLLMNCLLRLLVYPQQIADKQEYQQFFNLWLTEELVIHVGHDWGILPEYILCAGVDNKKIFITVEQLTMRNLVRQMRNQAAHARYNVNENDATKQIEAIEFKSDGGSGFHVVLPMERLDRFVRKLAQSALDHIPDVHAS